MRMEINLGGHAYQVPILRNLSPNILCSQHNNFRRPLCERRHRTDRCYYHATHRVRQFFVLMKTFLLSHFPSIRTARLAHKGNFRKRNTQVPHDTVNYLIEIYRTLFFFFKFFFTVHTRYPAILDFISHVIV